MVDDNNIRERMPWLFGGEKWVNKPSGWGHPYACIESTQCHVIARNIRAGKTTTKLMSEHWGVSPSTIAKILRDF